MCVVQIYSATGPQLGVRHYPIYLVGNIYRTHGRVLLAGRKEWSIRMNRMNRKKTLSTFLCVSWSNDTKIYHKK